MRLIDDGLAYHFLEKYNENNLSIDEILKLVGNEHYGNIELFKSIDFPVAANAVKDVVIKGPSIGDERIITHDEYLRNMRNLNIDGSHNSNDDYVNMNRNTQSRSGLRPGSPDKNDPQVNDSIEMQLKNEWGGKLLKTRRLSKEIQGQSFSGLDDKPGTPGFVLICNEMNLEFKRNNTVNNLLRSMQHNEALPSLVASNTPLQVPSHTPPVIDSCKSNWHICIYVFKDNVWTRA
jgi:hypothetical protein